MQYHISVPCLNILRKPDRQYLLIGNIYELGGSVSFFPAPTYIPFLVAYPVSHLSWIGASTNWVIPSLVGGAFPEYGAVDFWYLRALSTSA